MSPVSIAGRHRQLLAPSNTDADARVSHLASRIDLTEGSSCISVDVSRCVSKVASQNKDVMMPYNVS